MLKSCVRRSLVESLDSRVAHYGLGQNTFREVKQLAQFTVVIYQYDLMEKVVWCAIQHTVNSPQEGRECLIEETDHYAGRGQSHRIGPVPAPVGNSVHVMIYSNIMPNSTFLNLHLNMTCFYKPYVHLDHIKCSLDHKQWLTQKLKFCNYLLTIVPDLCFFFLWNTNGLFLKYLYTTFSYNDRSKWLK